MIQVIYNELDITEAIKVPIKLDDDFSRGCVSCSIDLKTVTGFDVQTGNAIFVIVNKEIWFEGFIFDKKKDIYGNVSITAHDPFIYLLKSKDDMEFRKKNGQQVIRQIFGIYGIKIKEICPILYIFPNLLFMSNDYNSIFDVILTTLYEDSRRTNKKYWIRYEKGARIFERKATQKVRCLSDGVENVDYSETIDGMVNRVTVVDREKNIVVTESGSTVKTKGLITTVEEYSAANKADATRYAKQKVSETSQPVKTRSINQVLPLEAPRFWSGDYVYISDPAEGKIAGFFFKKLGYELHLNYVKLVGELDYTADIPELAYKVEAS